MFQKYWRKYKIYRNDCYPSCNSTSKPGKLSTDFAVKFFIDVFAIIKFCNDKYELLETNMWMCGRGIFLIVLAVYKLYPGQSARTKQLYAVFKSATCETQTLFSLQQPSIPPYKMHLSVTLYIHVIHIYCISLTLTPLPPS